MDLPAHSHFGVVTLLPFFPFFVSFAIAMYFGKIKIMPLFCKVFNFEPSFFFFGFVILSKTLMAHYKNKLLRVSELEYRSSTM